VSKIVVEVAGGWTGAAAMGGLFSEIYAPADTAEPLAWAGHDVGLLISGGIGYWIGSKTTRNIYELILEH